jgi:hypothetical protein
VVPAVAVLGLGNLLSFALEVGAGEIIEQHVEARLKQLLPALPQVFKQGGLMLQNPIQAAIQPVLLRYREAGSQQIPHGALVKPLPVQPKLTAR